MKTIAACILLFASLSAVASAQESSPAVAVARWPQDRLAAISLTFDDGINTHLDCVAPILKKHHLNATFFVATAMGPWEKRKSERKQLRWMATNSPTTPCTSLLARADYTAFPGLHSRHVRSRDS